MKLFKLKKNMINVFLCFSPADTALETPYYSIHYYSIAIMGAFCVIFRRI